MLQMNNYINKKTINVILFFTEIIFVYLTMKSILYNDYIKPHDVTFYNYIIDKFHKVG